MYFQKGLTSTKLTEIPNSTANIPNQYRKINMNNKTPGTLVYKLSKNWNEADQETRNLGNYAILKKCLKDTVLNNLTPCSVKQCKIFAKMLTITLLLKD